jgi:ABC-2 type transport system ATP-binding protein
MSCQDPEGLHYRRRGPVRTVRCMTCIASLAGVEKCFGPVRAVDGVGLAIDEGEIVAILGPNGAGKTTTIEILLGLCAPDRGEAELFGGPPSRAIADGQIGAMLQDGGLMAGVYVAELLGMLRAQYPDPITVERAMTVTGLEGLGRRRVDRLSSGQTQRLRAACALIGNPKLLILDEPTAALDVEARQSFWAAMRSLSAEGRTIVFSTHYLEEADDFADRVVVLGSGRVLADGSPSSIKSTIGLGVVRCTLAGANEQALASLPAVRSVRVFNQRVELRTTDSDATLRALLGAFPEACAIGVAGAALEDAFLALTAT